jgi:hypothetical protein
VAAERDDGRAFVPRDDALHGGRIGPGRFGRSETRSKSCISAQPVVRVHRCGPLSVETDMSTIFFVIVCINWCFVFP